MEAFYKTVVDYYTKYKLEHTTKALKKREMAVCSVIRDIAKAQAALLDYRLESFEDFEQEAKRLEALITLNELRLFYEQQKQFSDLQTLNILASLRKQLCELLDNQNSEAAKLT